MVPSQHTHSPNNETHTHSPDDWDTLTHPMIGTCFLRVDLLRSSWFILPLVGGDSLVSMSTCSELAERSSCDSVRGMEEEKEEEGEGEERDRREEVDRDSGTVSRGPARLKDHKRKIMKNSENNSERFYRTRKSSPTKSTEGGSNKNLSL